jgi:two-component system, OmpR family, sensor kinase
VPLARSYWDFASGASHGLRDPITMCRVYLELLSDKPEEQQQTIALVLEELDRMARIVDALELLAEAERADFVRPEPIDLELFTHDLIAKASALAPRNWRLDGAAQGLLLADRHRLTEAIMNLAHNAVQHTLAGQTVAIGSSLNEMEGRLWVRDAGAGVPVSEQGRIFERFTRGREAHRRYRGRGLGLAIVKVVAEAHGGRIELESRLGAGSTFTMVLPRHPEEATGAWPAY